MKRGIDAYRKTAALAQRRKQEDTVRQFAPLVKKVAFRLVHRLPASVEVEDLISVGTIGLLQAIETFDEALGHRFEAYAEFRIKGAMLDELRTYDFMSRTARAKINKLTRHQREIEAEFGRKATVDELAEASGLKPREIDKLLAENEQMAFLTLEDLGVLPAEQTDVPSELLSQSRPADPFGHLFFQQLRDELVKALQDLPERLRLVLSLYYYNELNFKEIGRVLDLTESRISQLHSEAVEKLRRRLRRAV
ncbi:MAG: RNA polymerase sigma factor FliA [Myxococcales bacterium]|nr:RNA polymerase sigma factor FliA [Myxococcales bacterium]